MDGENISFETNFEFFGKNIKMSVSDRHDVVVMKCIIDIQTWEEEKGRGLEYMARLENAGIMICNEKIHDEIKKILLKRHAHEKR